MKQVSCLGCDVKVPLSQFWCLECAQTLRAMVGREPWTEAQKARAARRLGVGEHDPVRSRPAGR